MSTTKVLLRCIPLLCISFFPTGCNTPWDSSNNSDDASRSTSASTIKNPFDELKFMYDWNKQTDAFICSSISANNNLVSVGVSFDPLDVPKNKKVLDALEVEIAQRYGDAVIVVGREERLSILNLEMVDCSVLGSIRSLVAVEFVEAKYVTPVSEEELFEDVLEMQYRAAVMRSSGQDRVSGDQLNDEELFNPGLYDETDYELTYVEYIRQIDETIADRLERHGLNRIYEEFGFYGAPTVGVAIIDNGVFEDHVDYLSEGDGNFDVEGYVRSFAADQPDGPYPRTYDLFGLMPLLGGMFNHGTIQTKLVYTTAPNINIKSVRASPFVFWFIPVQFQGVVDAILALAEDPSIRVISSSMGTVVHVHEIERAIAYFNARDKIFVSAGGTSMPYLRDVVQVVFPANLASTITTTGIRHTQDNDGEFILGEIAHGGEEIDFVVDHTKDSSQSVSTTAGMIGLLWSYNPSLKRDQIIDILVRSSSYYKKNGKKDSIFGWGKIDIYDAFIEVKKLTD
ncbi:hypothetical protein A9Q99_25615 [Gammaproteobacteria bacterium 45_16_T64]|nr:hypothetical protein A9Q99_25615 [Gammaproteobacteria bacterium 45_16_T64]